MCGKRIRAKIGAAVLALLMAATTGAAAAADIDYRSWDSMGVYPQDVLNTKYFSSVKALMDAAVITGDTDGLFHPEKSITRAEFAAIAARATHQQNIGDDKANFDDMAGYGWAEGYINRCYAQGWIKGVGGSKFDPGRDVSYAEALTILIRIQRGQQDELIGPWPKAYIEYADMYNLTGTVEVLDWMAPALKGDVAIITNRMIPQKPLAPTIGGYGTFGKVTITGAAGVPLAPQTVVIDVYNDTFLDIYPNTDVTGWFLGLSANGLNAVIKDRIVAGMGRVAIEISGTPVNAASVQLSATVPSFVLKSGNAIAVSQNSGAVFDISL
ncbi:MAG: S-layer homology domain-containing protein [Clostridiales Family XIII bacterium]|jgi:hypothetical protein|nr:S-layer homology domain-containing protein [Clostridiales Family XIII bacterium]